MEANVFLLLLILVLMAGSKVQGDKVNSSVSLGVVPMLMFESKEAP